jgi:hypothetical protein
MAGVDSVTLHWGLGGKNGSCNNNTLNNRGGPAYVGKFAIWEISHACCCGSTISSLIVVMFSLQQCRA